MEKLEKIPEILSVKVEKSDIKEISYEGLTLIEERPYNGPTSIKYWM
jgi:hypothetical protein